MQKMEDSSARPWWRLTNMLIKVRNGALTKKMLEMEVGPQSLLKTKGQREWSSEFIENKQVNLFSR
jgi:hypothetical protein